MKHLKQLFLIAGISCGMIMTLKAQNTGKPTAAEIKYAEGLLRTFGDGKSTNNKKTSSGLLYLPDSQGKLAQPGKYSRVKIKYGLGTIAGDVTLIPYTKKPIEIDIDQLPYGIQEAVRMMPVGSSWIVHMPARLGNSKYKKIGDGRPLSGTVELISIVK